MDLVNTWKATFQVFTRIALLELPPTCRLTGDLLEEKLILGMTFSKPDLRVGGCPCIPPYSVAKSPSFEATYLIWHFSRLRFPNEVNFLSCAGREDLV